MPSSKLKLGDVVEGHTYMGGDPNNQQSWIQVDKLANMGLTGDDFLNEVKKSNPAVANQIKMLSEGRLAVPQARAATDPYWQSMMQLGSLYDPSLDQVDYPKRQATAKDFAGGGQAAQNIRNLNQAIGHMKGLVDSYNDVAGHKGLLGLGRAWNSAENTFADWNGDPGITDYNAHRTALASELAAVFKGKGASSETEVTKFYDMLNPNLSLEQKQANARALTNMLNSRLDELAQQYTQGMRKSKLGIDFLNPQARKDFDYMRTLGLSPNAVQSLNTNNPAAPAGAGAYGQPKGRKVGRFTVEEQ